jgi:tRNA A37 threonylcarbamoyladenosine biosynthesis protein TsaE
VKICLDNLAHIDLYRAFDKSKRTPDDFERTFDKFERTFVENERTFVEFQRQIQCLARVNSLYRIIRIKIALQKLFRAFVFRE